MRSWLKVTDVLPAFDEWVLVYSDGIDDMRFDIGYIDADGWVCLGWNYPVTHWMPLPEAP